MSKEPGDRVRHKTYGRGVVIDRPRTSFGWDAVVRFDKGVTLRFYKHGDWEPGHTLDDLKVDDERRT